MRAGAVAGSRMPKGYMTIKLDGRRYLAHRLAWLYVHGEWPPEWIDHKNRVVDDNRIANLRLASPTDNAGNRVKQSFNRLPKGVTVYSTKYGTYIKASVQHANVRHNLGHFDSIDAAAAAYAAKARELFGEFAHH
jgi:hypothetical protein